MRTYDLSPLFRSGVGFDRFNRLFDAATQMDSTNSSYPPYNIIKTDENAYQISLAVAGFSEDELDVVVQENTLTVKGRSDTTDSEVEFLHRGIAGRAFERRFQLADHIMVSDAQLENGLLTVDLVREVPEAVKPRSIAINRRLAAK